MTDSRSTTDATVTARARTGATVRPSARPSVRSTERPTVFTTARIPVVPGATENLPNLHQFLDYHLRQISKWLGGGL